MLTEDLEVALAARPGSSAPELAEALGKRTATVSKALYGGHGRFRCDGGDRWWLAGANCELVGAGLWRNMPDSSLRPLPTHAGGLPALALRAWQAEALAAWSATGGRGVVEAVTGTGKTRLGVAAALGELGARGQVLVLVPTMELAHHRVGELSGWLPPGTGVGLMGAGGGDTLCTHDVVVAVVNSARSLDVRPIRRGGLLVADECHRYGSRMNRLALDARFERRLGLSATYARDDEGHLAWLDPYFGPTCYRMGYARAVADGVTARFSVVFVGVAFSEAERCLYEDLSRVMGRLRAQLVGSYGVTPEPFHVFMKEVNHLAESDGAGAGVARGYRTAQLERRRLLADTPAKVSALAGLAPALAAADRAIVFTQSIRASEDASSTLAGCGLRAGAVHSGVAGRDRREVLERFGAGGLDVICAPRVLDEGIDVPAADLAVILGASRSRRQMIQRMGRVLRLKADGRPARFAVLFVEATVEDPAWGAHETFIGEVTTVADAVERLPASSPPAQACELLAWPN
ncbi:MAG: DEAD/DEAH box helicase [Acidimicrobiales bacterium]